MFCHLFLKNGQRNKIVDPGGLTKYVSMLRNEDSPFQYHKADFRKNTIVQKPSLVPDVPFQLTKRIENVTKTVTIGETRREWIFGWVNKRPAKG